MQLRSVLYLNNIKDFPAPEKRECLIVQKLDYTLARNRNEVGTPYGTTLPVLMSLQIRLGEESVSRELYHRLQSRDSFSFSVLHNPEFDGFLRLKGCSSSFVATGFVVDMQQTYEASEDLTGERANQQAMIQVQVLLDHISYQGAECEKTLTLFNN